MAFDGAPLDPHRHQRPGVPFPLAWLRYLLPSFVRALRPAPTPVFFATNGSHPYRRRWNDPGKLHPVRNIPSSIVDQRLGRVLAIIRPHPTDVRSTPTTGEWADTAGLRIYAISGSSSCWMQRCRGASTLIPEPSLGCCPK